MNRSKWGVWNYGEYVRLYTVAAEVLRAQGSVELLGPAVIDFEYHATAALLNLRRPGLHFDVVSALLYVDRRGAPENRQTGLDTVDKALLLKAVAETSRNATGPGGSRCWITEFNWPLWEGPHSPAGREVSVDEETQASYLVRYYLLALGSGAVERVYWWQLMAKGYGLVDPADGRRRPSFHALATLLRELKGCTFLGPRPAPPGARLMAYRRPDGGQLVIGWSLADRAQAELPAPAGRSVELRPAPQYFHLPPDEA